MTVKFSVYLSNCMLHVLSLFLFESKKFPLCSGSSSSGSGNGTSRNGPACKP